MRDLVARLFVLVAASGCVTRQPSSKFPSATDALQRMKASYACANGVGGHGKIERKSPEGQVTGDMEVLAVNPARVRIDVTSAMAGPVLELASDGQTFQLSDKRDRSFVVGPAKACNLARLTRVQIPGHALVALLRGEAPLLVHNPKALTMKWDHDHYRIDIPSSRRAGQRIHLRVHDDDYGRPWQQQRVRVTLVTVFQHGGTLYRAKLSEHALTHTAGPRVDEDGLAPDIPPSGGSCATEVPRNVRLSIPSTKEVVEFRYDEVKLNPPIVWSHAFGLTVPDGMTQRSVDCIDR